MKKLYCGFLLLSASSFPSFSQNPGDATFFSPNIHTINFYFSQINWYDSLIAYKPLDKKMPGNVMIDGTMIDSVGVQFFGNSSFGNPSKKKPWKIDFNEYVSTQTYDGLKGISLSNGTDDPTMMREKIMCDFLIRNGLPAYRCTYANVYVNDTLWGFYTLYEQVNKTFLKRWFTENDGNLFKPNPVGSLQWNGSTASQYYSSYQLKTNTTVNDWTDLIHLIDKINNSSGTDFYDSLEAVMRTDLFIRSWAANILFVNFDIYQGTGQNYYLYHDLDNNKFGWINHDVDESFGTANMGMSSSQVENLSVFYIMNPPSSRPLASRMLQNTLYKNSYIGELCNFVASDFDTTFLYPIIDSLTSVIRPYIYADPNKLYTNSQFETNINSDINGVYQPFNIIPGLKSFLINRRASVISELAANGCFMGTGEYSVYDLQVTVSPNPNNGQFAIYGSLFPVQIKIYTPIGQKIHEATLNSKQKTLNLYLPNGIYFLQIIPLHNGTDLIQTKKLIIK